MAITVSHKEITYTGYVYNALEAIYNYMTGPGAGRFTIVDSSGIGAENGWFVFELVGGTGWQCWLGARHAAASTWSTSNMYNNSTPITYMLFVSFSPKGGWNAGTDSPGATMFSLCPSENGGPQGQFWLKIMPALGSASSTLFSGSLTLWDDPDEGFFMFLYDREGTSTWAYGGPAIMPLNSRFGLLDSAPYALLCGAPKATAANDWFHLTSSATYSSLLLPGDDGSPPTRCQIYLEPLRVFSSVNLLNNPNDPVDFDEIGVYTLTGGVQHNRGFIKPQYLKQGWSPLAGSGRGDTGRRMYDNRQWIVPINDSRLLIPWDNNIKP